jgi:hypothetical protein
MELALKYPNWELTYNSVKDVIANLPEADEAILLG